MDEHCSRLRRDRECSSFHRERAYHSSKLNIERCRGSQLPPMALIQMSALLLVEDDPVVSRVCCHHLFRGAQLVEIAATLEEACALAASRSYERIFVDLDLGTADCVAVVRAIEARRPASRIYCFGVVDRKKLEHSVSGDNLIEFPHRAAIELRILRSLAGLAQVDADDRRALLRIGGCLLNRDGYALLFEDARIRLSFAETRILEVFAKSPFRIHRIPEFLSRIWGDRSNKDVSDLAFVMERLVKKLDSFRITRSLIEPYEDVGFRIPLSWWR